MSFLYRKHLKNTYRQIQNNTMIDSNNMDIYKPQNMNWGTGSKQKSQLRHQNSPQIHSKQIKSNIKPKSLTKQTKNNLNDIQVSPLRKSISKQNSQRQSTILQENKLADSYIYNNILIAQEQKRQQKLPVAYFFDKNKKKEIIKSMIDSYFDNNAFNPQKNLKIMNNLDNSIKSRTFNLRQKLKNGQAENKNTNGTHNNLFATPFSQRKSSIQKNNIDLNGDSKSKISSKMMTKSYQKYNQKNNQLQIKNFAKTQGFKLFHSLVETPVCQPNQNFYVNNTLNNINNSNLPTISEDIQIQAIKRPHSQERGRNMPSQVTTLKRRQSGGFLNQQKKSLKQKISSDLFQSNFFQQSSNDNFDIPLSESLLLAKNSSNYSNISFLSLKSNQSFLSQKSQRQEKQVRSGSVIKQSKYYTIKVSSDRIVKSFSQIGLFLLSREKKAKNLGARTLWHANPYKNQLQLQMHTSLAKQLYYRVSKVHGEETVYKIYLNQQKYSELFANNSQYFKDIIIGICKQLIQLQNKVIINGINIENICRLKQKQIRIIDWSGAAIREKITTLDKVDLVKVTEGAIKQKKEQRKATFLQIQNMSSISKHDNQKESYSSAMKWIWQPQYLAPQIIESLKNNHTNEEALLWKSNSNASDIWSLGCLIFQIINLIPFQTNNRCNIKGRSYFRRGVFSMPQFSYTQLQRKQKLFSTQALRLLKRQCLEVVSKVDRRILQVLEKMLVYQKDKRIKPKQAIQILSK